MLGRKQGRRMYAKEKRRGARGHDRRSFRHEGYQVARVIGSWRQAEEGRRWKAGGQLQGPEKWEG